VHQLFQVERQAGGWHLKRLGQGARRQTRLTRDDQAAKDPQAQGLCQRSEGTDNVIFFHISIIVE
jgi:hypothetical protein